jgi:hypothetical protein
MRRRLDSAALPGRAVGLWQFQRQDHGQLLVAIASLWEAATSGTKEITLGTSQGT